MYLYVRYVLYVRSDTSSDWICIIFPMLECLCLYAYLWWLASIYVDLTEEIPRLIAVSFPACINLLNRVKTLLQKYQLYQPLPSHRNPTPHHRSITNGPTYRVTYIVLTVNWILYTQLKVYCNAYKIYWTHLQIHQLCSAANIWRTADLFLWILFSKLCWNLDLEFVMRKVNRDHFRLVFLSKRHVQVKQLQQR